MVTPQKDCGISLRSLQTALLVPVPWRHEAAWTSQTNREAIVSRDATNRLQDCSRRRLRPIEIRRNRYLNNRIEQDHRRIKRRVRPMLGFKSQTTAEITLSGIEMVHMMRKRQARYAFNPNPSLAEQFEILAAA